MSTGLLRVRPLCLPASHPHPHVGAVLRCACASTSAPIYRDWALPCAALRLPIGTAVALAGSIRSCYNTPAVNYDSWKPNAMLCSGTTIGTRRGIERYLRTPVGARGHYVCFVPFSTSHYTLVRFSTLSYTLVRFSTLSYAKPIRFGSFGSNECALRSAPIKSAPVRVVLLIAALT